MPNGDRLAGTDIEIVFSALDGQVAAVDSPWMETAGYQNKTVAFHDCAAGDAFEIRLHGSVAPPDPSDIGVLLDGSTIQIPEGPLPLSQTAAHTSFQGVTRWVMVRKTAGAGASNAFLTASRM